MGSILRRMLVIIAGCIVAFPGYARQQDGSLGLVLTPNNGVPALVTAGGVFRAELAQKASLSLVRDGNSRPITAEWHEIPGGHVEAVCTVPADLAKGAYMLSAEISGSTDQNERSVWVWDRFPEYYVLAHLTDVHIGRKDAAPGPELTLQKILENVNASDTVLTAITGDLTDTGSAEQFQEFLRLINTCTTPTIVCPGNHDRNADHYEKYFGPLTYRFTFGRDGYLAFDTKDYVTADDLGGQSGRLQEYRREIKPCRWSIGLTHRYEPTMGMRAQLTLFVDEPLDFLLIGHIHRELEKDEGIPWGKTMAIATPASLDGRFRFIDVTAQGLLPRPVTSVLEP